MAENHEFLDVLLDGGGNEENQEILVVDILYKKAYSHFQVTTIISLIYSILKVIAVPIFLICTTINNKTLQAWMICLMVVSFIQIFYYIAVYRLSGKLEIFIQVANKLQHAAHFSLDEISEEAQRRRVHDNIYNFMNRMQNENDDRTMRMLALQLKFHALNQELYMMIVSKVVFLIYQGIHVWGVIIFFNGPEDSPTGVFMTVILFIGTYQYLQFYTLLILVSVIAPFILIYMAIKSYIKKKRQEQIARKLQGEPFNPNQLQGDHTCSICMEEYKQEELISTLPCNKVHHFHQECLAEWVKVSNTCPMCRVDIN